MGNKLTGKAMLAVAFCMALTACGGGSVREQLGLKKDAPDEFMVLSRPSLSTPPSFNLPVPGSAAATESNVSAAAERAVFSRGGARKAANASAAERSLLSKAGTNEAKDNIRDVIDAERRNSAEAPVEGLLGSLLPDALKPDEVINADEEAQRLKEEKATDEAS